MKRARPELSVSSVLRPDRGQGGQASAVLAKIAEMNGTGSLS